MIEDRKQCCGCKQTKVLTEFNKCKTGKYGLHNHCRDCQKKHRKRYYKTKERPSKYWLTDEHRKFARERNRARYSFDLDWKEQILEQNRIRRRRKPAKIKARVQRNKWIQIPHNRIAQNLRGRIRSAINGATKDRSTESLIGCSFEQLREYLESKFQPNMSWDNYGEWHIDHIVPCSFFDMTKPEHQQICFHYLNLQPLWKTENISKHNRINLDNIQEFIQKIKRAIAQTK